MGSPDSSPDFTASAASFGPGPFAAINQRFGPMDAEQANCIGHFSKRTFLAWRNKPLNSIRSAAIASNVNSTHSLETNLQPASMRHPRWWAYILIPAQPLLR